MIKCISIDGPDGSGKSTLVELLSNEYEIVTLPKYYSMGMTPVDPEERKKWFRTFDVFDTTRIYISGHKIRLVAAAEFKKGLHYKFLEPSKKERIVVLDRGALSVNAFAYAAIKMSSDMQDDEIIDYLLVENDIEQFAKKIIDVSILLFDPNNLEEIISRRKYDECDEYLARYQHEYYCKRKYEDERIKIISPTKTPEEILNETKRVLTDLEVRNV